MTAKTFRFGRFYARSEKHLTDALNKYVGPGKWMKTDRMLDQTGYGKVEDRKDVPRWIRETRDLGGGRFHDFLEPVVYRGILFRSAEDQVNAMMFINPVEAREDEDDVLARSYHTVEMTDEVRKRGIGDRPMPWEDK